jgi:hypothetical protein
MVQISRIFLSTGLSIANTGRALVCYNLSSGALDRMLRVAYRLQNSRDGCFYTVLIPICGIADVDDR